MASYFLVNAMAFFVGWCWLVVSRNLFAQFAILFEFGVNYIDKEYELTIDESVGDVVGEGVGGRCEV